MGQILDTRPFFDCHLADLGDGEILLRWRKDHGSSQQALGASLRPPRANTTVSEWESGHVARIPTAAVSGIDDALGAGGAFTDLLRARSTPHSMAAATSWQWNLPEENGPVWVWIRPDRAVRAVRAIVSAGPALPEVMVPPNGLIITSPASAPGLLVNVELEAPGWADIGRGVLPEWLPVAQVPLKEILGTTLDPSDPIRVLLAENLRRALRQSGRGLADLTAFLGHDGIAQALGEVPGPQPHNPSSQPILRRYDSIGGPLLRSIRERRGLSLKGALTLIADLPFHNERVPSRSTLERLEQGGLVPPGNKLVPRLDMVYKSDGNLTCMVLGRGEGRGSILLPPYWVGPVWVELEPAGVVAPVQAEFVWDQYRRPVNVTAPECFSFRKNLPGPGRFSVEAPGCRYAGGIGRCMASLDVNHGWSIDDPALVAKWAAVLLMAYGLIGGRTPADIAQFLAPRRAHTSRGMPGHA